MDIKNILSTRSVICNPPVELNKYYIDNPAFNFYSPAQVYYSLKDHSSEMHFVDAFKNARILHNGTSIVFGNSYPELIEEIKDIDPEFLIIHYSSFLRFKGLLNKALLQFIKIMVHQGRKVILADMYNFSTHYLDFKPEDVKKNYPDTELVLKRVFPFGDLGIIQHPPDFNVLVPAYSGFIQKARELDLIKDASCGTVIFPYLSSIGCPYNCLFCKTEKHKWISHDTNRVLIDMDMLKQNNIDTVYILDAYFNYNPKRAKTILKHCRKLNLKLHFSNGIGIRHIDDEIAELLSQTTERIYISPESLLDEELAIIRKPFNSSMVEEKVKLLHKYKNNIHAHYILNVPGSNKSDPRLLYDAVKKLDEKYSTVSHFQHFVSIKELVIDKPSMKNVYEKFFSRHCPESQLTGKTSENPDRIEV